MGRYIVTYDIHDVNTRNSMTTFFSQQNKPFVKLSDTTFAVCIALKELLHICNDDKIYSNDDNFVIYDLDKKEQIQHKLDKINHNSKFDNFLTKEDRCNAVSFDFYSEQKNQDSES